jgi:hypothetical protein
MGQARTAARTASLAGLSPAQILHLVDHLIDEAVTATVSTAAADAGRRSHGGPQFATALHAVLDLHTGRARFANSGRLPVLLHCPDSATRTITIPPGPPLGLGQGAYPEALIDLPHGASLLLFTDGLVEDPHETSTPASPPCAASSTST